MDTKCCQGITAKGQQCSRQQTPWCFQHKPSSASASATKSEDDIEKALHKLSMLPQVPVHHPCDMDIVNEYYIEFVELNKIFSSIILEHKKDMKTTEGQLKFMTYFKKELTTKNPRSIYDIYSLKLDTAIKICKQCGRDECVYLDFLVGLLTFMNFVLNYNQNNGGGGARIQQMSQALTENIRTIDIHNQLVALPPVSSNALKHKTSTTAKKVLGKPFEAK